MTRVQVFIDYQNVYRGARGAFGWEDEDSRDYTRPGSTRKDTELRRGPAHPLDGDLLESVLLPKADDRGAGAT